MIMLLNLGLSIIHRIYVEYIMGCLAHMQITYIVLFLKTFYDPQFEVGTSLRIE